MTNNQLTRERIELIANFHRAMELPPSHAEIEELARMALAAMDSEPVFILEVARADYKGQKLGNHFGFITLDAAHELKEGNYQLYRHAQPAPVAMDSEPVIVVGDDGGDALSYRRLIQSFEPGTKLYRHAQPAPVVLKISDEMTSEQAYEIGDYHGDPVDVFARGANWMRQHIIDSTSATAPQEEKK